PSTTFIGGGGSLYIPSHVCYIDSANASSSFVDAYPIYCGNSGVTGYSTANGKIALIAFDIPLPAIYATNGESWQIAVYSEINVTADFANNTTGNTGSATVSGTLRSRPIIAAYDISALTWNSYIATPPTFGSLFNEQNFSANTTTAKNGAANTNTISAAGVTFGSEVVGSNQLIYGFVFDAKLTWTTFGVYNPSPSNHSVSIDLNPLPINATAPLTQGIYVFKTPVDNPL
ncbi:MAG TPA: hypothetical protein VNT76_00905, partial [Candidatus Binatus sp.]|nr:hypothetical protein [Candidatus Binatus sp.]